MNKSRFIPAGVLAVTLFAGLGISAFATDNPQGGASSQSDVQDVGLNERVESLLHRDVGLAGSQFRVQVKAGIVTLGGNVPDEHALRRALDLVSSVKGVREIRNGMVVEFPK